MVFDSISAALGLACILVLAMGISIVSRGNWFLGWIRGLTGLFFIALSILSGLAALDLRKYRQVLQDEPIATISFSLLQPDTFRATLAMQDFQTTYDYELIGDQWQIDAKILRWKGRMEQIGGKSGYRLDRISGRYLSIEKDRANVPTEYEVIPSSVGVDLWQWAYEFRDQISFLEASYGSAAYMPMADGAIYELALSFSGLEARPLNSTAKEAVFLWK